MVPFYKERLATIDEEIDEKNHPNSNATKKEKEFLQNSRDEV